MRPVTRIAREINLSPARANNESAPKGAVTVARAAARPVLRRCQSDVRSGNCNALPPVQLVNLAYAEFREKCPFAEAGDEPRRVLLLQPQQRLDVQVVIVVVCDEHQVNRWQRLKCEAWVADAPWTETAERTDALRIDRIRQHVEAVELQQERDVVDERERYLTGRESRGQCRLGAVLNPLRPEFALPRSLPAQEVLEGSTCLDVGVEEQVAVEVVRLRALVAGAAIERAERIADTPATSPGF